MFKLRLGLTALYNKAAHQVIYEGWHFTHSPRLCSEPGQCIC